MAHKLVTLMSFKDPTEAHFYRALLESEDIPVFLQNEYYTSSLPMASPLAIELQVPEDCVHDAQQIIEQSWHEMTDEERAALAQESDEHAEDEADGEEEDDYAGYTPGRGLMKGLILALAIAGLVFFLLYSNGLLK